MEPASNGTSLRRFAGRATLISAGLTIMADVFLILFFAMEAPGKTTGQAPFLTFGTISDATIPFRFLALLVLPLALHQLAPPSQRALSALATALGLVGMVIIVIAQALLVARVITFVVNLPYVMAGHALSGAWALIASYLGRASGALTARLARLGTLVGAVYLAAGIVVLLWLAISAASPQLSAQLTQGNLMVTIIVVILGAAIFLGYIFGLIVWLIALGRWLMGTAPAGLPAPQQALS
jgi:hypothetical protein